MPTKIWTKNLMRHGTAFLRKLPAETAHELAMHGLERGWFDGLLSKAIMAPTRHLKTKVPGIGDLSHPIGLAAGFDKDCRAPKAFAKMGFSFLEVGTVTPRPQVGNPKPRLFRYPEQLALVNRMGFNSAGASLVCKRLREQDWDHNRIPLGVNLGKNKLTPKDRALDDYLQVFEAFQGLGRYFVINISSPNTPGLRDLASADFLEQLGSSIGQNLVQVWVKLDPDMSRSRFQQLVETIAKIGFQGVILGNSHRVEWPESGGLSGHPLAVKATKCLEWAHEVHRGELPMIALGGILGGLDVFERISRGALAVQIYTALVYRGPAAVAEILTELAAVLKQKGFASVEEARNSFYLDG